MNRAGVTLATGKACPVTALGAEIEGRRSVGAYEVPPIQQAPTEQRPPSACEGARQELPHTKPGDP
jgi:hypothetical protein